MYDSLLQVAYESEVFTLEIVYLLYGDKQYTFLEIQ
jgi:hypothetical protein